MRDHQKLLCISGDELGGWTFMVSTSSSSWEFIAHFSLQHFISSSCYFFRPFFDDLSPLLDAGRSSDGQQISLTYQISSAARLHSRFGGDFDEDCHHGVTMAEEICDNWKHFFCPHLITWEFSLMLMTKLCVYVIPLITDAERSYRSDCETDDGISLANDNEFINGSSSQQLTTSSRMKNRSPLGSKRGGGPAGPPGQPSSPFPNEMTNRRMQNAHERLRNGECEVHKV